MTGKDTVTATERLRAFMVRRPDSPVRRFVRRMVEVGHIRRANDAISIRRSRRGSNRNNNDGHICALCGSERGGREGRQDNEQHEE